MMALYAGLFFAPLAAQAQLSAFTTDGEGWQVVSFANLSVDNFTIVGTYNPTYFSSGGNPGGYIFSSDPDGGDFMFSAPAAFLGNQSAYYGGSFSYSIRDSSPVNYNASDLMLVGGGLRLLWQQNPSLDPTGWTAATATLSPSSQWRVSTISSTGGPVATMANFMTVLGNLTGVYIRGEYAFGPDSTALDNVQFSVVPEPMTLALFAAGLLPIALLTRRRCRKSCEF